jgi:hypothetical protein
VSGCDEGGTCAFCNEKEEDEMPKPKEVYYLAHPVSDDPEGNVKNTLAWLAWLEEYVPSKIFIAPWVGLVMTYFGRDVSQEVYDRALADDCEVVRRCDGVLMVGGRVSKGMALEAAAAQERDLRVICMATHREPPPPGAVSGYLAMLLAS